MEMIDDIMNCIMTSISNQMSNLENVNTKELSEAMDMIKDLSMAKYYCSIVKAMDESKEYKMTPEEYRDMELHKGRMHYTEMLPQESRYDKAKKYYTEMHSSNDKQTNMNNLEKWLNTIKDEIKERIASMSNEEKTMTRNVMNGIANTI